MIGDTFVINRYALTIQEMKAYKKTGINKTRDKMIMCEVCKTKITINNFWAKKHKGHAYIDYEKGSLIEGKKDV